MHSKPLKDTPDLNYKFWVHKILRPCATALCFVLIDQ